MQSNIVAISVTKGSFVCARAGFHYFLVLEWIIATQMVQVLLNLASH